MNRTVRILTCFLLAAAASLAATVDDFLHEVESIVLGNGAEAALKALDARLAKGDLSPADAGRLTLRKIQLLGKDRRDEAGKLVLELVQTTGVLPETKVDAANAMLGNFVVAFGPPPGCAYFVELTKAMRGLPEFKAKGVNRARFLEFEAKTYARRNFCDLAAADYAEAAENYAGDPDRQIAVLFKAADYALRCRDVTAAQKALASIEALPDLPPATVKKAKLRRGLALIGVTGYNWQPSPARVAEARAIIEDALAPLGRQQLLPADEIFRAKARIVLAEYRCGNAAEAARLGQEVLEAPIPKGIGGKTRDDFRILVADILAQQGDWKQAIKYYEQGMTYCSAGKKTIHKRIAGVARKHKDYQRAMQAYGDAASLCDRVEGKDEIALLKRLAGLMSKAIRNKTSLSDADDVFGNDEDALGGLQLDEL